MVLIQVRVVRGDAAVQLEVQSDVWLRDVQAVLCKAFRQRFPVMMATLCVRGTSFDSFKKQPFLECVDGEEVLVSFVPTDDPFFYDLNDRRGCRTTVLEDLEAEAAGGDAQAAAIVQEQSRNKKPAAP